MPETEFTPDARLVRRLIADQGDDELRRVVAAGVEQVGQGWDNAVFRLGGPSGPYVARLPVRAAAVGLVEHELRWLGEVTEPLREGPVRVAEGVLAGRPGAGYPWPWAVLTWLDGDLVSRLAVPDRNGLAEPLAGALARLHRPAPVDAPDNPLRAVPLAQRAADVEARWPAVREHLGRDAADVLRSAWESGLDAPSWDRAPVWVHGDPHPSNLVHRSGRDLGIVDFGDVTAGDPATDVATAWLTFDAAGRRRFLDVLLDQGSYDDALEARAAAWAALVAAAVSVVETSGAEHRAMARHVVDQLGG